jgi:hypothetical protein
LSRISQAILRATLEVSAADGEFAYRFDEEATT